MSEGLSCVWCERLFRTRQSGGRTQRFCRPSCRRHYHAAVRQWTLAAIARGDLTIADIRTGVPATRALPAGAISTVVAPEAPQRHPAPNAPAEETVVLGHSAEFF